jgi:hypothetical protein
VRKLENKFSSMEVHHVVRKHNVGADKVAIHQALTSGNH